MTPRFRSLLLRGVDAESRILGRRVALARLLDDLAGEFVVDEVVDDSRIHPLDTAERAFVGQADIREEGANQADAFDRLLGNDVELLGVLLADQFFLVDSPLHAGLALDDLHLEGQDDAAFVVAIRHFVELGLVATEREQAGGQGLVADFRDFRNVELREIGKREFGRFVGRVVVEITHGICLSIRVED